MFMDVCSSYREINIDWAFRLPGRENNIWNKKRRVEKGEIFALGQTLLG